MAYGSEERPKIREGLPTNIRDELDIAQQATREKNDISRRFAEEQGRLTEKQYTNLGESIGKLAPAYIRGAEFAGQQEQRGQETRRTRQEADLGEKYGERGKLASIGAEEAGAGSSRAMTAATELGTQQKKDLYPLEIAKAKADLATAQASTGLTQTQTKGLALENKSAQEKRDVEIAAAKYADAIDRQNAGEPVDLQQESQLLSAQYGPDIAARAKEAAKTGVVTREGYANLLRKSDDNYAKAEKLHTEAATAASAIGQVADIAKQYRQNQGLIDGPSAKANLEQAASTFESLGDTASAAAIRESVIPSTLASIGSKDPNTKAALLDKLVQGFAIRVKDDIHGKALVLQGNKYLRHGQLDAAINQMELVANPALGGTIKTKTMRDAANGAPQTALPISYAPGGGAPVQPQQPQIPDMRTQPGAELKNAPAPPPRR